MSDVDVGADRLQPPLMDLGDVGTSHGGSVSAPGREHFSAA